MNPPPADSIHIKGIGVSPGIALGKAFLVERGATEILPSYSLETPREVDIEKQMFRQAVELTRNVANEIATTNHHLHHHSAAVN